MKTWQQFCQEPNRHSINQGGEFYRFINEEDYNNIQKDAIQKEPQYHPHIPLDQEHQTLRGKDYRLDSKYQSFRSELGI